MTTMRRMRSLRRYFKPNPKGLSKKTDPHALDEINPRKLRNLRNIRSTSTRHDSAKREGKSRICLTNNPPNCPRLASLALKTRQPQAATAAARRGRCGPCTSHTRAKPRMRHGAS